MIGVCWSVLAYSPTADGLATPGMLTCAYAGSGGARWPGGGFLDGWPL